MLELLHCRIAFHVLLVGMDTKGISLLPDEGYITAAKIDKHFAPPKQVPQHPSDELEEDNWHDHYRAFDKQCWEWWRELLCSA